VAELGAQAALGERLASQRAQQAEELLGMVRVNDIVSMYQSI